MKVTVDSKKGLKTNLKVFVDKKTIDEKIVTRLNELSKTVNLKGFRPGKVPPSVIKSQFGKAIYGEVIDKLLKETSNKAIEENKIKVAGQPKIDLKSFGEGKDLNYTMELETLPEIKLKSLDKIIIIIFILIQFDSNFLQSTTMSSTTALTYGQWLQINIIKVPFSPLTSFKEIILLSVEFNSKFSAFFPKSHIGVFVSAMLSII